MIPWLKRFRGYPLQCLGHIAWGILAGYVGGVDGLALLLGGWAYQFGSGWRKLEEGHIDTVGLDCFDYALGYAIGVGLKRLLLL